MPRQTFDRCRTATLHIAGQATRHGIPMLGPLPGPGEEPYQAPDVHWPGTLQWLWFVGRHRRSMDTFGSGRRVQPPCWTRRPGAASGILKVWLSTHNPRWRYRHGLVLLWDRIQQLENPEDPQSRRAVEAAPELEEYTTVEKAKPQVDEARLVLQEAFDQASHFEPRDNKVYDPALLEANVPIEILKQCFQDPKKRRPSFWVRVRKN